MLSSCGVKWFQIEILWIESLLEMLLHCHSPARALVCKHFSLTNDLRQLCHLRHLDVCRSIFCLDVSRRGCSASASSMTRSWWVHYCESFQWTQVQAASVQFLNRGHVWVVALLAQNLQDLLHHSVLSIGGSVEFCHKLSIVSLVCQDVNSCCWWLPSDYGPGPRYHSRGMFDWLECVLSCVSIIQYIQSFACGVWIIIITAAGHCISWAGSSGEMAKVQGEPWFKLVNKDLLRHVLLRAFALWVSVSEPRMNGGRKVDADECLKHPSLVILASDSVILSDVKLQLVVGSSDHLQNYSLWGKRKRCCTTSWGRG